VQGGITERWGLPFPLVKNIITEGRQLGYRRLHLTGGEPLLWKKLFETLDHAFYLGYQSVLVNTNGTLLSEVTCRKLAERNGVVISVSLDGPEKFHNRLRGQGAYHRAVRGIENALNASITPIVFTTAYKCLLPELPNFAENLFEKFPKIKYLSLIPLIKATNNGFALSEELLEPDDFVRFVRTIALLNTFGLKIAVLNEPLVNVVANQLEMPWFPPSVSMDQQGNIIIMANRTIGLSHFNRTFFGRYAPGMIKKVLTSNAYEKSVLADESTCPSCNFQQTCLENGMRQPSQSYGKGDRKEPYCRSVLNRTINAN
jgi:MoaA/NifB/PqqE/SkfB family radical SAM enzyme